MLVAAADLLEAEGRLFREQAARVGQSLGLVVVAMVLVITGAGFLVWALYQYLQTRMTAPGPALVTGLAAMFTAGIVLWVARQSAR